MIHNNLVITKLKTKDPNNRKTYRVWWDAEQYLGYFTVDGNNKILFANKLINKQLNAWKEFDVANKQFTHATLCELIKLFADGIPRKVEFEGFEWSDISELDDGLHLADYLYQKEPYIKNSLLKILENPVPVEVDDQIFNAFMNRG